MGSQARGSRCDRRPLMAHAKDDDTGSHGCRGVRKIFFSPRSHKRNLSLARSGTGVLVHDRGLHPLLLSQETLPWPARMICRISHRCVHPFVVTLHLQTGSTRMFACPWTCLHQVLSRTTTPAVSFLFVSIRKAGDVRSGFSECEAPLQYCTICTQAKEANMVYELIKACMRPATLTSLNFFLPYLRPSGLSLGRPRDVSALSSYPILDPKEGNANILPSTGVLALSRLSFLPRPHHTQLDSLFLI